MSYSSKRFANSRPRRSRVRCRSARSNAEAASLALAEERKAQRVANLDKKKAEKMPAPTEHTQLIGQELTKFKCTQDNSDEEREEQEWEDETEEQINAR